MSASSCLFPTPSWNVQVHTFSSTSNFYACLDEFVARCGYLVFKKTPASFVGELVEDRSIPKPVRLTYQNETLVFKMFGPMHEIANGRLRQIVGGKLLSHTEVVPLDSIPIITDGWTKIPDASWGPYPRREDPPGHLNTPSSRTLVIETGSSEPGWHLRSSAQMYLDAGIPYVILLDLCQRRPRITIELLEARTRTTRDNTIIVERNDDGEIVLAQEGAIILSIADLARRGHSPGDRYVAITAEDAISIAKAAWAVQFP